MILLLVLEQIVASKTWISNTDRLHTTGRYSFAVITLKASMYPKDVLAIGSMSLISTNTTGSWDNSTLL
ncbi:hypothetical protein DPMN_049767 [Dreissena polymorpha]|uniref:Uncharacterized protein n=1 Tax=Dreissena polymorpha TaxID=45954 RepID=A0A9D4HLL7_DREPO|nr:hypothetical protein DPMN_049767 [Dreissena polymorpha]